MDYDPWDGFFYLALTAMIDPYSQKINVLMLWLIYCICPNYPTVYLSFFQKSLEKLVVKYPPNMGKC